MFVEADQMRNGGVLYGWGCSRAVFFTEAVIYTGNIGDA